MATTTSPTTQPQSTASEPEKKSINIPLNAHVYDYYQAKAKEDDRTLNSYLARLLHAQHKSETAPAIVKGSASLQPGE